MGRWAQAQRRGTVAPGETVNLALSAPDVGCPVFNEDSNGANTDISISDYTCGPFPDGAQLSIGIGLSDPGEAGAIMDAFDNVPLFLGTLDGGAGTLAFFWNLQWVDGLGNPISPASATQHFVP